jgi:threonyl-tRNA synthetase
MRHSAAHVLAEAMLDLMPDAELGLVRPSIPDFITTSVCPGRHGRSDLARRAHAYINRETPPVSDGQNYAPSGGPLGQAAVQAGSPQDLDDNSITQCTHAEFTDLCRGGRQPLARFRLQTSEHRWSLLARQQKARSYSESMGRYSRPPRAGGIRASARKARRPSPHRPRSALELFDGVGPGHVVWLPAGATVRRAGA